MSVAWRGDMDAPCEGEVGVEAVNDVPGAKGPVPRPAFTCDAHRSHTKQLPHTAIPHPGSEAAAL